MRPQGIDFAPIDPSRSPARWEQRIQEVTERAWAARMRRLSVGYQLAAWCRPALAAAAALALVSWGAPWAMAPRATPASAAEQAPTAEALARWAGADEMPSTPELLALFGGHDGSP